MQTIGIETAQNVVVQHEIASLGDRIVAYIFDALVLGAWLIFLAILVIISIDNDPSGIAIGILVVLALIPYLFYHLVCEITMDGQSIGKRARKIRVSRVDGGQPRIGQYLLRWVLRPIDGFYYVGLVVILINGKGQRLGDLAAGTTVVSLKPRLRLQDTLMTDVKPQHQVRFPESVRLNDAQVALVKEVLNNFKVGNRSELLREMAEKVSLAIGNTGSGQSPEEFLRAVLQDYVHLTGQAGQVTSR
ncbi:MAG: RDD family protein [Flavobacteriales bacterium]|nr:RDD family protein [Flavobacteriales bacterium]